MQLDLMLFFVLIIIVIIIIAFVLYKKHESELEDSSESEPVDISGSEPEDISGSEPEDISGSEPEPFNGLSESRFAPVVSATAQCSAQCSTEKIRYSTCMALKEIPNLTNMNYYVSTGNNFTTVTKYINNVPMSIEFGMEITEKRNTTGGDWSGLFTVSEGNQCRYRGINILASYTLERNTNKSTYSFYSLMQSKDNSISISQIFKSEDSLSNGKYIVKREIKQVDNTYKMITTIKNIEGTYNKQMETNLTNSQVNFVQSLNPSKMFLCTGTPAGTGIKLTDIVFKGQISSEPEAYDISSTPLASS